MRMDEHNDNVIYNEQNAQKLSVSSPHKTKTHRTETRLNQNKNDIRNWKNDAGV